MSSVISPLASFHHEHGMMFPGGQGQEKIHCKLPNMSRAEESGDITRHHQLKQDTCKGRGRE